MSAIFMFILKVYCFAMSALLVFGALFNTKENPKSWWLVYFLSPLLWFFIITIINI